MNDQNDSLKQELEEIKAETPIAVKADPISLLYGIIFVALGAWLVSLGGSALGFIMILVGVVGVIAGIATFVWKSPKVKLIQAIDGFAIALVLFGFAIQGEGEGIGEGLGDMKVILAKIYKDCNITLDNVDKPDLSTEIVDVEASEPTIERK